MRELLKSYYPQGQYRNRRRHRLASRPNTIPSAIAPTVVAF